MRGQGGRYLERRRAVAPERLKTTIQRAFKLSAATTAEWTTEFMISLSRVTETPGEGCT
ncbi:MAG: hypothetical protein BWY86_01293 [Candidatus Aminicenantes bacterium ADurb.Bin508]|nr:MAG: hypothetical protein BWY86_01293 [Candidatus Aminicenantes bacterium ADurb.Bin508]